MTTRSAFYLVVDERLEPVASVLACRLFDLWGKPVHVFVEGHAPGRRSISGRPGVFFHDNLLGDLVPQGLPEDSKWPRIVYSRIFAPRFLRQYDRLIYLDADILPLGTDEAIWTMPLEYGVGVVQDCGRLGEGVCGVSRRDWLRSIGVHGDRYFNSGVLVLDTERWLAIDFDGLLRRYAQDYGSATTYFDQDFLNFAFQEQWTSLSPSWNFQASLFPLALDEICPPLFLHFSKYEKPWLGQFDPAIDDIDKLGYEHLTALAALYKVDLSTLRKVKKTHPLSRLKNGFRRQLSSKGLQSGKERFLRRAAERQRADIVAYLVALRLLAAEECQGQKLQRQVSVFDGKVLRMPASDLIRTLLGQPLAPANALAQDLPPVKPSRSGGPSAG